MYLKKTFRIHFVFINCFCLFRIIRSCFKHMFFLFLLRSVVFDACQIIHILTLLIIFIFKKNMLKFCQVVSIPSVYASMVSDIILMLSRLLYVLHSLKRLYEQKAFC